MGISWEEVVEKEADGYIVRGGSGGGGIYCGRRLWRKKQGWVYCGRR